MKKSSLLIKILIFLYAVNFLGKGELLPLIIIPLIMKKIILTKYNKLFVIILLNLLCFLLFFSLISFMYGYISILQLIGKIVFPILFLFLGYLFLNENQDSKSIIYNIYLLIIGIGIYALLSSLKTLYLYNDFNSLLTETGGRNVINIWNNNKISATALTAYLSFLLISYPAIFYKKLSVIFRFVLLLLIIFTIYTVIGISSRTAILILITSFIVNSLYSTKGFKRFLFQSIFLLISIILGKITLDFNILNSDDRFKNSLLYKRFLETDIKTDDRFLSWVSVIKNLPNSLTGGREIFLSNEYAHNLWLDVAYDAGIIPFVFLLIFTLLAIGVFINYLFNKNKSFLKRFMILIHITFYIVFMLEPTMQGLTFIFTFYCFIVGMMANTSFIKIESKDNIGA